jgi:1-acyl-sn-glycerol-3-phosphate acyltransferase
MTHSSGRDIQDMVLGEKLPRRGNKVIWGIARFLFKLIGWKMEGELPNVAKAVIIAAPHTSNWDFVIGMIVIFALGIRLHWLGKHTLFTGPFAPLMRWLGGLPVNRTVARGAVKQVVAEFKRRQQFILAIAPEGTRKKVAQWKTGFYYIAEQAQVPILPVTINYQRQAIQICPVLIPSGDIDIDLPLLQSYFNSEMGKKPHQF